MHYTLVLTGSLENRTITRLTEILRIHNLRMTRDMRLEGGMFTARIQTVGHEVFMQERELMEMLHKIPGVQGVGFCADAFGEILSATPKINRVRSV